MTRVKGIAALCPELLLMAFHLGRDVPKCFISIASAPLPVNNPENKIFRGNYVIGSPF
jgi:hypothetical protein